MSTKPSAECVSPETNWTRIPIIVEKRLCNVIYKTVGLAFFTWTERFAQHILRDNGWKSYKDVPFELWMDIIRNVVDFAPPDSTTVKEFDWKDPEIKAMLDPPRAFIEDVYALNEMRLLAHPAPLYKQHLKRLHGLLQHMSVDIHYYLKLYTILKYLDDPVILMYGLEKPISHFHPDVLLKDPMSFVPQKDEWFIKLDFPAHKTELPSRPATRPVYTANTKLYDRDSARTYSSTTGDATKNTVDAWVQDSAGARIKNTDVVAELDDARPGDVWIQDTEGAWVRTSGSVDQASNTHKAGSINKTKMPDSKEVPSTVSTENSDLQEVADHIIDSLLKVKDSNAHAAVIHGPNGRTPWFRTSNEGQLEDAKESLSQLPSTNVENKHFDRKNNSKDRHNATLMDSINEDMPVDQQVAEMVKGFQAIYPEYVPSPENLEFAKQLILAEEKNNKEKEEFGTIKSQTPEEIMASFLTTNAMTGKEALVAAAAPQDPETSPSAMSPAAGAPTQVPISKKSRTGGKKQPSFTPAPPGRLHEIVENRLCSGIYEIVGLAFYTWASRFMPLVLHENNWLKSYKDVPFHLWFHTICGRWPPGSTKFHELKEETWEDPELKAMCSSLEDFIEDVYEQRSQPISVYVQRKRMRMLLKFFAGAVTSHIKLGCLVKCIDRPLILLWLLDRPTQEFTPEKIIASNPKTWGSGDKSWTIPLDANGNFVIPAHKLELPTRPKPSSDEFQRKFVTTNADEKKLACIRERLMAQHAANSDDDPDPVLTDVAAKMLFLQEKSDQEREPKGIPKPQEQIIFENDLKTAYLKDRAIAAHEKRAKEMSAQTFTLLGQEAGIFTENPITDPLEPMPSELLNLLTESERAEYKPLSILWDNMMKESSELLAETISVISEQPKPQQQPDETELAAYKKKLYETERKSAGFRSRGLELVGKIGRLRKKAQDRLEKDQEKEEPLRSTVTPSTNSNGDAQATNPDSEKIAEFEKMMVADFLHSGSYGKSSQSGQLSSPEGRARIEKELKAIYLNDPLIVGEHVFLLDRVVEGFLEADRESVYTSPPSFASESSDKSVEQEKMQEEHPRSGNISHQARVDFQDQPLPNSSTKTSKHVSESFNSSTLKSQDPRARKILGHLEHLMNLVVESDILRKEIAVGRQQLETKYRTSSHKVVSSGMQCKEAELFEEEEEVLKSKEQGLEQVEHAILNSFDIHGGMNFEHFKSLTEEQRSEFMREKRAHILKKAKVVSEEDGIGLMKLIQQEYGAVCLSETMSKVYAEHADDELDKAGFYKFLQDVGAIRSDSGGPKKQCQQRKKSAQKPETPLTAELAQTVKETRVEIGEGRALLASVMGKMHNPKSPGSPGLFRKMYGELGDEYRETSGKNQYRLQQTEVFSGLESGGVQQQQVEEEAEEPPQPGAVKKFRSLYDTIKAHLRKKEREYIANAEA